MSGEGIARTLPQQGLVAITWAGVGLASIFVAGRTAIRIGKVQRLHMDDYLIYCAFLVLIANAVLQTYQTPYAYYIAKAEAGLVPLDELLIQRGNVYLKFEFTIIGLFWTILWLVKASFLAFFYHLFDGLPKYRRMWWGVVIFSFFAYSGCWIASINNCHPAKTYFQFGKCDKPIDLRGSVIAISYSTTVDVLTDFLIMAMPLNLLWKVRISRKEKMGLAAVFSIGLIIIVFAIVRAVQITFTARTDAVLLSLWGILESSVSVVVGCLPPFKSLFSRGSQPPTPAYYERNYGDRSNPQYGRNTSIPLNSFNSTSSKGKTSKTQRDDLRSESREGIVEIYHQSGKEIFVRRDVSVISDGDM